MHAVSMQTAAVCSVCGADAREGTKYCTKRCAKKAHVLGLAKPQGQHRNQLPVRPLRRWLRSYVIEVGGIQGASRTLGYSERRLWAILREQSWITLDVADKILVAAEAPGVLNELYPLEEAGVQS